MESNAAARGRKAPKIHRVKKVRLFGSVYNLSEVGVGSLLLIPSAAFLIFVFVIPVVQVIQLSFTNYNTITGAMRGVGFSNYVYLLTGDTSEYFYQALGHTVVYAAVRLAFDITIALLHRGHAGRQRTAQKVSARVLFRARRRPDRRVQPDLDLVLRREHRPIQPDPLWIGLPTCKWLLSEKTSLMSILIFSIWKGLGYNVILFLAGLQNISDSYLEAGRIDGASSWQLFWKIKLPLLRPIMSFVIMMDFIQAFKVFTEVNVMTPDGGPLRSTMLLVNYIYELAFTNGRMGRASACALILFVIIFIFTMIQRKIGASKTVDYE
jgi:ABC-type sugar transport system permease subunit